MYFWSFLLLASASLSASIIAASSTIVPFTLVERSSRQITPSGFPWTQLEPDIGELRLMSG
jgi:hypothetical protein